MVTTKGTKSVARLLTPLLDSTDTLQAHAQRTEYAKAQHRLAVANKADRQWYDPSRANNGRMQTLHHLERVRHHLAASRLTYPDYAADQEMLNDMTRVRRAVRTLMERIRTHKGNADLHDYGED